MSEEKRKIESQDEATLKEIGRGLALEKIFCDRHCREELLSHIFMPIPFGALADVDITDIGLIYEYLDKAGTRSINRMPIFMSMKLVNQADTKIVMAEYNRIRDVLYPEQATQGQSA